MLVTNTHNMAQGCLDSSAAEKGTEEPELGEHRHEHSGEAVQTNLASPEDQTPTLKSCFASTALKWRNQVSLSSPGPLSERGVSAGDECFPDAFVVVEDGKKSQVICASSIHSPSNNSTFQEREGRDLPTLLSRGSSPGCASISCLQETIVLPPSQYTTTQNSAVSQSPDPRNCGELFSPNSWSSCKNLQFIVLPLDSRCRQTLEGQALDSAPRCAYLTTNLTTRDGDMPGEPGADQHKKEAQRWKLKALSLRQRVVAGNLTIADRHGSSPPCSLPSCQVRPAISPSLNASTLPASRISSAFEIPPHRSFPVIQMSQLVPLLQKPSREMPTSGEKEQGGKPPFTTEAAVESTTANGVIQGKDHCGGSDDSISTHQREWISVEELKTMLRERLTELENNVGSSSPNNDLFEGRHGEKILTFVKQEESTKDDVDREGGQGPDGCNAAQVLHDILKSRQIAADELENYREKLPSLGALLHEEGLCKPCVFANKANKQCLNGVACLFCHHFHKEKRKRSRKARTHQKHVFSTGSGSPVSMSFPDSHRFAPLLHPVTAYRNSGLCHHVPGRSSMPPVLGTPFFPGGRSAVAGPMSVGGRTGSLPALLPGGGGSAQFRTSSSTSSQPPPPPPPPSGLQTLITTDMRSWNLKGQTLISLPRKSDSGLCPTLLTGGRCVQSLGSGLRHFHVLERWDAASPQACSGGGHGSLQKETAHAKRSTMATGMFSDITIPDANSSTSSAVDAGAAAFTTSSNASNHLRTETERTRTGAKKAVRENSSSNARNIDGTSLYKCKADSSKSGTGWLPDGSHNGQRDVASAATDRGSSVPSCQSSTDRSRMTSRRAHHLRRVELQHEDGENCFKKSEESMALRARGGEDAETNDDSWLQDRNSFVFNGMTNDANPPQNTVFVGGCSHASSPNRSEYVTDGSGSKRHNTVSSLLRTAPDMFDDKDQNIRSLEDNEKQESERVVQHPPMICDGDTAVDDLAKSALGRLNRDELVHLMDLIVCTLTAQNHPAFARAQMNAHLGGEHPDSHVGSTTSGKLHPEADEAERQTDEAGTKPSTGEFPPFLLRMPPDGGRRPAASSSRLGKPDSDGSEKSNVPSTVSKLFVSTTDNISPGIEQRKAAQEQSSCHDSECCCLRCLSEKTLLMAQLCRPSSVTLSAAERNPCEEDSRDHAEWGSSCAFLSGTEFAKPFLQFSSHSVIDIPTGSDVPRDCRTSLTDDERTSKANSHHCGNNGNTTEEYDSSFGFGLRKRVPYQSGVDQEFFSTQKDPKQTQMPAKSGSREEERFVLTCPDSEFRDKEKVSLSISVRDFPQFARCLARTPPTLCPVYSPFPFEEAPPHKRTSSSERCPAPLGVLRDAQCLPERTSSAILRGEARSDSGGKQLAEDPCVDYQTETAHDFPSQRGVLPHPGHWRPHHLPVEEPILPEAGRNTRTIPVGLPSHSPASRDARRSFCGAYPQKC